MARKAFDRLFFRDRSQGHPWLSFHAGHRSVRRSAAATGHSCLVQPNPANRQVRIVTCSPCFIAGNPASEAAVADWNASSISRLRPTTPARNLKAVDDQRSAIVSALANSRVDPTPARLWRRYTGLGTDPESMAPPPSSPRTPTVTPAPPQAQPTPPQEAPDKGPPPTVRCLISTRLPIRTTRDRGSAVALGSSAFRHCYQCAAWPIANAPGASPSIAMPTFNTARSKGRKG
jgi:hypothetical protein